MTLNKHTKIHGDRTIGGAITVKRASKNTRFLQKMTSNCRTCSYIHTNTRSSYLKIDLLFMNNFASGPNAVNQIVH